MALNNCEWRTCSRFLHSNCLRRRLKPQHFSAVFLLVDKCPIIGDQPQLSANWIPDACVPKAVLLIDSTYAVEVHYWRVTVAEDGVATGNGGRVLLIPRNENRQRFVIPSNILGAGAVYYITVEGLQLSNDGFDSFKVSRIVCRRSGILETYPVQGIYMYTHVGMWFL